MTAGSAVADRLAPMTWKLAVRVMPLLVAVTVMLRLARSLPMPTCATTTPVALVVVPLTVATALLFTLILTGIPDCATPPEPTAVTVAVTVLLPSLDSVAVLRLIDRSDARGVVLPPCWQSPTCSPSKAGGELQSLSPPQATSSAAMAASAAACTVRRNALPET